VAGQPDKKKEKKKFFFFFFEIGFLICVLVTLCQLALIGIGCADCVIVKSFVECSAGSYIPIVAVAIGWFVIVRNRTD
jgi:hypothetical protein